MAGERAGEVERRPRHGRNARPRRPRSTGGGRR
jgi:hypothetical protein